MRMKNKFIVFHDSPKLANNAVVIITAESSQNCSFFKAAHEKKNSTAQSINN